MGYYVNIIESTARIPAENLARVYEIMCSLNDTCDHLKHGRSFSGGKQTGKWFSWMDANYPKVCKDAQAILEMLGFETEYNKDGDLFLVGYDQKTGQEDLFLEAIENYVVGEINWVGEDDEQWTTEFLGDDVIDGSVEREALTHEPQVPGAIAARLFGTR